MLTIPAVLAAIIGLAVVSVPSLVSLVSLVIYLRRNPSAIENWSFYIGLAFLALGVGVNAAVLLVVIIVMR